jgi:hypothetical protein
MLLVLFLPLSICSVLFDFWYSSLFLAIYVINDGTTWHPSTDNSFCNKDLLLYLFQKFFTSSTIIVIACSMIIYDT